MSSRKIETNTRGKNRGRREGREGKGKKTPEAKENNKKGKICKRERKRETEANSTHYSPISLVVLEFES